MLFLSTLVKHGIGISGKSKLNYWGQGSLKDKKYHESNIGKPGPQRIMDMSTEFLCTMIWYRHGFVEEYLAFMFKMSPSTISRTLITWTQFIYEHCVGLVYMPTYGEVLMNMPLHFINHSNTYCVSDCTEIQMESPQAWRLSV